MKIIKSGKDGYRLVRKEDGYTTNTYPTINDAALASYYTYNELDIKGLHRYFGKGLSERVFDELFNLSQIRDE